MSVNSNPVKLFIPHEHYKFKVDLVKKNVVQKVLPSHQLRGKQFVCAGFIALTQSIILSSPSALAALSASAAIALPSVLPICLCASGVLSLALAIYCFTKKSTVVEEQKLPVEFQSNPHYNEIKSFVFDMGNTAQHVNGISKESLDLNLDTILVQPEFRINPLNYIAKWKQLRGEMKELKIEEDLLLNFFTDEKVQKYLTDKFPAIPQNLPNTPQAFIPHKHYHWSLAPKGKIPKFTYDHFCQIGQLLKGDLSTELGSNLFVIATQKDFLADPVGYIAQWKKSRGDNKINTKDTEYNLLSAFTNEKVQHYLTKNFHKSLKERTNAELKELVHCKD